MDSSKGVIRRTDLLEAVDALLASVRRLVLVIEGGSPNAPVKSSIKEKPAAEKLPLNGAIEETSIVPSGDLLPLFAYAEAEGPAKRIQPTQTIIPTAEANNEDQPPSEENCGFAEHLVEIKDRRGDFGLG